MAHHPRWIEVGKNDCSECNGTGVYPPNLINRVSTVSYLKRMGYKCQYCNGTGKKSVGYMDLRDASGR